MDSDVGVSIVKVLIIGAFVAWLIIRSNKKDKETEKSTQEMRNISFREIQEKREESFKQALRENGMSVLGDKKEELITKIDKSDFLDNFMKMFLGSLFTFMFFYLIAEALKSDKTVILGGVDTGIPIYIIIVSISILGFLIYLNYKLENLILDLLKLIFIFLLRIALFCLFLFCLYSVIANIIHFNIFMAILWTLGAIVSFFIFMFSIQ